MEFSFAWSRGLYLALSGFLFFLLLIQEKQHTVPPSIIAYGLTLTLLYLASTIYHGTKNEKRKRFWRKIDHISIYLSIAGTYTPVALIMLEKSAGWAIFYIVWIVAAIGTVLKLFFTGKYELISVFFYLITGWIILLDVPGLMVNASCLGVFLVFFGGALYTIGVVFYSIRMPYKPCNMAFSCYGRRFVSFSFYSLGCDLRLNAYIRIFSFSCFFESVSFYGEYELHIIFLSCAFVYDTKAPKNQG